MVLDNILEISKVRKIAKIIIPITNVIIEPIKRNAQFGALKLFMLKAS